jgi:nitrate/nitrite transporter NarK
MAAQTLNPATGEWAQNWPVVLASAAGVALSTVHIYSLGVMIAPLEAEFGWSRAQISSGMMIGSVVALLLSPFVGMLVDRIGPRRIALCGGTAYCVMVAMLSLAGPSIWSWMALWTALAIGVKGLIPLIWTAAISSLFVRARGLALALTLCGAGLGATLTPVVTSYLNEAYGWRMAYVGLGAFWALLVLPLLFFLFTSAKDRQRSAAPSAKPDAAILLTGLTAREGFRSLRFYKLAVAAFGIALVAVSFTVNLVPILTSTGLSQINAAEIAGLVGLASITGRLLGGYLIDRISGSLVAAVAVLLPIVSCTLLLSMPGMPGAAKLAAVFLGLALGAELDAVAYLATRHLGMLSFGLLFGVISGLLSLATGLGPLIVSYSFDVTGTYSVALWTYIPVCVLSAVLFLSLGRYPVFPEHNQGEFSHE